MTTPGRPDTSPLTGARSHRRALLMLLWGVLSGLLVMTACTPGPAPVPTPSPPPAPTRVVPDPLPDRDAAQVFTEASTLDWCALLDPGVAAELKITSTPEAGLGICVLDEVDYGDIWVSLTDFNQLSRFQMDPVNLGGAKGYFSGEGARETYCDYYLPIDQTRAVRFRAWQRSSTQSAECSRPQAFATKAAATLMTTPGAFRRPAATSDSYDLCGVMQQVLGEAPVGSSYRKRPFGDSALTDCGLWPTTPAGAPSPVQPQTGLTLNLSRSQASRAESGSLKDWQHLTVADTSVYLHGDKTHCEITWDARASRTRADRVVQVTLATGQDCATSQDQLPAFITALAKSTPPTATGAQLLYRFDEPDTQRTGVCADAINAIDRQCVDWTPGAAPATGADLISRGRTDATVICASTEKLISAAFPEPLKAVTVIEKDGMTCEYVTPDHSRVVRVMARDTTLVGEGEAGTVAGHPSATSIQLSDYPRGNICLALTEDEPGILCLDMYNRPPRSYGPYEGGPVDEQFEQRLTAAATQLAENLL